MLDRSDVALTLCRNTIGPAATNSATSRLSSSARSCPAVNAAGCTPNAMAAMDRTSSLSPHRLPLHPVPSPTSPVRDADTGEKLRSAMKPGPPLSEPGRLGDIHRINAIDLNHFSIGKWKGPEPATKD
jgi:hypothetical protein